MVKLNPKYIKKSLSKYTTDPNKSSNLMSSKSVMKSLDSKKSKKILKINNKKKTVNKTPILNNYELNILSYKDAIKYDKRTFLEMYFGSIKQKQLILFTFYPQNDYNLRTIKYLLFILSLSLYFTVSSLFFTDGTMDKINFYFGQYNFLSRFPNMIYSSLITAVINTIVRNISLTQKSLLVIKREKTIDKASKQALIIFNEIKIKIIIFFILGTLFMAFYCYFISCFCAVYKNTQIILIKDTLVSFTLSMSYAFLLAIFTAMFRFYAIKGKKENKKCMFSFSGILSVFY